MPPAASAPDAAAADGDPEAAPPVPTYRSLAAPVCNPVDKFALLPAFLKVPSQTEFLC
jgi:DNA-directed RNA polymerase III subunit RPC2